MKKLTLFSAMTALLFSSTAMANAPVTQEQKEKTAQELGQPLATLVVFDTSGKERKLMKGNALSRTKKRQLCLVIENVPSKEQNRLVEYFKAPKEIIMQAEGAKVQSSADKTEYFITFDVPKSSVSNNRVMQCWNFGQKDPIGTYQFEAQFNDIVFKGLSFRILK